MLIPLLPAEAKQNLTMKSSQIWTSTSSQILVEQLTLCMTYYDDAKLGAMQPNYDENTFPDEKISPSISQACWQNIDAWEYCIRSVWRKLEATREKKAKIQTERLWWPVATTGLYWRDLKLRLLQSAKEAVLYKKTLTPWQSMSSIWTKPFHEIMTVRSYEKRKSRMKAKNHIIPETMGERRCNLLISTTRRWLFDISIFRRILKSNWGDIRLLRIHNNHLFQCNP
jgi:hypothetical protein